VDDAVIELQLNGKARSIPESTTVSSLLDLLELSQQRLAVECNGEIVPKSQHDHRVLQTGDRVEIVQAIGGG